MIQVHKPGPVLAVAILFAAFLAQPAFGQVPPRFYWKGMNGTNAVPVIYMSLGGNANPADPAHTVMPGVRFEAEMIIAGYGHLFELFGRSALVAGLVPMGRISGDFGTFNEQVNGFGDPLVEFGINLIGPDPIRNIPDIMRYEPGFQLDVIVDLAFPIGEYDNDTPLNIGQNRWYGRVGFPIVWQLGPWIPNRRTTLEFLPSVWLFGDNDDPFMAQELSTDPMFALEGHLTRNFAKDIWGSLDLSWLSGGQASIDGVEGEDADMRGLGFTLGYQLNDHMQLTLGYMASVGDDEPGDLNMDSLKVSLIFGWHKLIEGMTRIGGES
jgi:hypothetical protein